MEPEKNWGAEPWRKPEIDDGDIEIFSECGRGLDGTCYRSHWFMMVKQRFGGYVLLVKHGGGQERFNLGYMGHFRGDINRIVQAMEAMDSDARYLMLHTFYDIHTDARRKAQEKTRADLLKAFAEGRIKKQKIRGQSAYKVKVLQA